MTLEKLKKEQGATCCSSMKNFLVMAASYKVYKRTDAEEPQKIIKFLILVMFYNFKAHLKYKKNNTYFLINYENIFDSN
jgi:hypothetical protein